MTSLAALAPRVRFNEMLLAGVAKDLGADAWSFVPPGGGNTAHWILGHVVTSRRFMLRAGGHELALQPWEEHFGRGAEPGADTSGYPSPEELIATFKADGDAISEHFPSMTQDQADAAAPRPMPDGSDTVEGVLHFLYFHEIYHLGQIGLIRRMNGLERFV